MKRNLSAGWKPALQSADLWTRGTACCTPREREAREALGSKSVDRESGGKPLLQGKNESEVGVGGEAVVCTGGGDADTGGGIAFSKPVGELLAETVLEFDRRERRLGR
jgi:hypothetical protein